MAGATGVAPSSSSSRTPIPPARPLRSAEPTESHDVLLGFGEPIVGGVLNALVQSRQARWRAESAARDARIAARLHGGASGSLATATPAVETVSGETDPTDESLAIPQALQLANALSMLGEAGDTAHPNSLDTLSPQAFSQVLHSVQHASQVLRDHPLLGEVLRRETEEASSEHTEEGVEAGRGRPVDTAPGSDIFTISDTTESHRDEAGRALEGPSVPSVEALADYYTRLSLWEDEAGFVHSLEGQLPRVAWRPPRMDPTQRRQLRSWQPGYGLPEDQEKRSTRRCSFQTSTITTGTCETGRTQLATTQAGLNPLQLSPRLWLPFGCAQQAWLGRRSSRRSSSRTWKTTSVAFD
eukprot:4246540-Amphidinium_carterae.2